MIQSSLLSGVLERDASISIFTFGLLDRIVVNDKDKRARVNL